jgi:hypothetical protein
MTISTTIQHAVDNNWLAIGDKIELVNSYRGSGWPAEFVDATTSFTVGGFENDADASPQFINGSNPIDDPRYFPPETQIRLFKDVTKHVGRLVTLAEGEE